MYVRDVKTGTTNASGEPSVIKESGATALVDGNNLLGSEFSIYTHLLIIHVKIWWYIYYWDRLIY
jgi:LDH2 family malate/lactate/ureidoglycolate dehydrogenase